MTDTPIKQYGDFGIYSGGDVTIEAPNQINISPFTIRLSNGELRGVGSYHNTFAKQILLGFSDSLATSPGYDRENLESPKFILTINIFSAGNAWIYYSEGDGDLVVSTSINPPAAGTPIFCKITWPGWVNLAAANINDLVVDYSVRTESLLVSTLNPEEPRLFYEDGQTWTAASVNRQYANISVLTEVLQSESLLNFGDSYFVTFAREASGTFGGDIYGDGLNVIVKDIRHMGRVGSEYFIYHNKTDSGYTPADTSFMRKFTLASEFQNKTIYVGVKKDSGELRVETTWTVTEEADYYLIAYAQVGSESVLDDVHFYIVNNLSGQSLFLDNFSRYLRTKYCSGFLNPLVITELAEDNKLRIEPNILCFDGYLLYFEGVDVTLPAPSVSGYRQDFVFFEIEKKSIPWIQLSYKIKVVEDINYLLYRDPFLNVATVKNDDDNPYVYQRMGHYSSDFADNLVDGKTHAIPIMVVSRFNSSAYNAQTNKAGGIGRPDNKTALRINLEEVEKKAPVLKRNESLSLLNSTIFKILNSKHNNLLQPTYSDPYMFSRSPLQVDRLGTNAPMADSSFIGTTDGIRYLWSRNKSKIVKMYGLIKADEDSGIAPYNFPTITYDQDLKYLVIKVPDDTLGSIVSDQSTGMPLNVSLKWVSTGRPVILANNWSIGQMRNSSALIDTGDPDYIADGEIAIIFYIRYEDIVDVGLKQIPSNIISAANNNSYSILSESYAIALDSYINPTKVKDLSSKVIGLDTYTDFLSIIKMGSDKKYYSYELHYFMAGNNSNANDYEIDEIIGDYTVIGLINAFNAVTGEQIPITKVKQQYNSNNNFLIRLAEAVSDPVEFVFGVGGDAGKQIDISIGSLEISNLTETHIFSTTGSEISHPDGIYFFSNGHLIYGASSMKNNFMVFVGNDLVPASIHGIGDNLIKVVIQLTAAQLTLFTGANWELNVSLNRYVPANGVTIRIPVMQSLMLESSQVYLQYQYNSLPFMPFIPDNSSFEYNNSTSEARLPYVSDEKATVVNRGFLVLSTDGTANDSSSIYSPIDYKLPVVQGVTYVGLDTPPSNLGMNDVFIYQQQVRPFIEGEKIDFNGELILSGIVQIYTGLAAWFCLVKQLTCIRLFLFECREGVFALKDKDQAFICELEENYREIF